MNLDEQKELSQEPGVSKIFNIQGDLDGDTGNHYCNRERFIGLLVGGEEFLLSIVVVDEIIMLTQITYVPNAPKFIEGVLNLRGTIIPAVNLRKMMGRPRGELNNAVRVIISKHQDSTIGLLVDGITYVTSVFSHEIETINLSGIAGSELISSISKHDKKVLGIIEIEKVIQMLSPKSRVPTEGSC